jgi:hypothetical protein
VIVIVPGPVTKVAVASTAPSEVLDPVGVINVSVAALAGNATPKLRAPSVAPINPVIPCFMPLLLAASRYFLEEGATPALDRMLGVYQRAAEEAPDTPVAMCKHSPSDTLQDCPWKPSR